MGLRYLGTCEQCSYQGMASGGRDCGFFVWTESVICNNCTELLDVQIGYTRGADEVGMEKQTWHLRRCSTCRRKRDILTWDESHPCPKCGATMVREEEGGLLWD